MVNLQIALEEGLKRALGSEDKRPIICHRGSLDPLAYWLQRGWPEEEFFAFTGFSLEDHYRRYTAVIHLVTAADGAPEYYRRWPEAHRPEGIEEAVKLDRWLREAWRGHPNYYCLGNDGCDWETKARRAKEILAKVLKIGVRGTGLG